MPAAKMEVLRRGSTDAQTCIKHQQKHTNSDAQASGFAPGRVEGAAGTVLWHCQSSSHSVSHRQRWLGRVPYRARATRGGGLVSFQPCCMPVETHHTTTSPILAFRHVALLCSEPLALHLLRSLPDGRGNSLIDA
jgi:hypothetical protein